MNHCPLCLSQIAATPIRVDLSSNHAVANGIAVKLTPSHAEILHIAIGDYPRYTSTERIMQKLYGGTDRVPESGKTVAVMISRMNISLKSIGYALRGQRGKNSPGYRLIRDNH